MHDWDDLFMSCCVMQARSWFTENGHGDITTFVHDSSGSLVRTTLSLLAPLMPLISAGDTCDHHVSDDRRFVGVFDAESTLSEDEDNPRDQSQPGMA
jgi:hypothetical protein